MQTVYFLYGLPGSGKSTWAFNKMQEDPKRTIRVNKDDIRAMISSDAFANKLESYVNEIQDAAIHAALEKGFNVIVDNTHIKSFEHHVNRIKGIMKNVMSDDDLHFEVIKFDTPIEECIERDQNRNRTVGADVIMNMARGMI